MRKVMRLLALLVVVLAIGAVAFGSIVWGRLHEPYKGYADAERFVEIPPGAGRAEIARRLVGGGIVRDDFILRAALWWTGEARNLKAGEYRFDRPQSAVEVVERLARGDVYTRRITFPEGLTIVEMAKVWEDRGFGSAGNFRKAAANAALIEDLDPRAPDLEGYLFPETYSLARGTAANVLVEQMVGRFREAYGNELRTKAEALGLTTREVVTLASLVEKETAKGEERPLVSAVYHNRLKIGMGMQADPTVIYALQKAGTYDGNIRRSDLQVDSPYNTYRYPGLPPGPIASPGKASLEASVAPADVKYLYFVSRNDGTHVFAETLSEHNRNVRRFQIQYFREKRQREQAGSGGGRSPSVK